MTQEPTATRDSLISTPPVPGGAAAFSERVHGLLDGQPNDEATVAQAFEGMDEMFDVIAAGLYNLASMLVGEGEEGVRLVETAVATTDVSACKDPVQARTGSRRALCNAAIGILERRTPGCLAAPEGVEPAGGCIEDDDLNAAGVSSEELERMIAGPDRDRVRNWLASLPTAMRVVFVMRAVAGFTSPEAAALLAAHGGPTAAGWTADGVRTTFRQGLCSLASQLIHSTTAR